MLSGPVTCLQVRGRDMGLWEAVCPPCQEGGSVGSSWMEQGWGCGSGIPESSSGNVGIHRVLRESWCWGVLDFLASVKFLEAWDPIGPHMASVSELLSHMGSHKLPQVLRSQGILKCSHSQAIAGHSFLRAELHRTNRSLWPGLCHQVPSPCIHC